MWSFTPEWNHVPRYGEKPVNNRIKFNLSQFDVVNWPFIRDVKAFFWKLFNNYLTMFDTSIIHNYITMKHNYTQKAVI